MVLEHNGVMWTLLLVLVKTWCLHRDSPTTLGRMKPVLLLLLGAFSALPSLPSLFLIMNMRWSMTMYLYIPLFLLLPLASTLMKENRLLILNLLGLWLLSDNFL